MIDIKNLESPIYKYEKDSILKDGTKIVVKGYVFERPMFSSGEKVFNFVQLYDTNGVGAGIVFFREQMIESELEDKVNEICENPDNYLADEYKQNIQN